MSFRRDDKLCQKTLSNAEFDVGKEEYGWGAEKTLSCLVESSSASWTLLLYTIEVGVETTERVSSMVGMEPEKLPQILEHLLISCSMATMPTKRGADHID